MLLSWLARLRQKRTREIFQFWDGTTNRRADPLGLWLKLQSHSTYNLTTHPAMVDSGDPEALKITIDAVRDVFGVKSFEDGGLTAQECLTLLVGFFLYLESQKKSTNMPQTQPSPSEQMSSESGITTTKDMLDSGSTSSEPNTGTRGGL